MLIYADHFQVIKHSIKTRLPLILRHLPCSWVWQTTRNLFPLAAVITMPGWPVPNKQRTCSITCYYQPPPPHLLKRHPCSNHAKSKLIFSAFHRKGGRVTEPETCWIYGVDQSAPNLMTWLPTRRPPAPCPLTESQLHRSSFKHAAAPRKFLFFHH